MKRLELKQMIFSAALCAGFGGIGSLSYAEFTPKSITSNATFNADPALPPIALVAVNTGRSRDPREKLLEVDTQTDPQLDTVIIARKTDAVDDRSRRGYRVGAIPSKPYVYVKPVPSIRYDRAASSAVVSDESANDVGRYTAPGESSPRDTRNAETLQPPYESEPLHRRVLKAGQLYTKGYLNEARDIINPIALAHPQIQEAQILKRHIDNKLAELVLDRNKVMTARISNHENKAEEALAAGTPKTRPMARQSRKPHAQAILPLSVLPDAIANTMIAQVSFRDTPMTDVVRALGKLCQQNVVVASGIKAKVTLDLSNTKLVDALEVLCRIAKCSYSYEHGVIVIEAESNSLVTVIYGFDYADAQEHANIIERLLTEGGTLDVDAQTNRMIIRDGVLNHRKISALVRKLDRPVPQVMIDAKLVSVNRDNLHNIGVKWGKFLDGEGGRSGQNQPSQPGFNDEFNSNNTGSGVVDFAGPSGTLRGGQILLGITQRNLDLNMTIDAILRKSDSKLLASPRVATENNRQAKIVIGEKIPFKEKTQTTTGTTETTKFIDVGISLLVTPRVSSSEMIQLTIHTEDSKFIELIDNQPRVETSEADTVVSVRNKGVVVIGGLLKTDNVEINERVPVLGKIPIIGRLFSSKSIDALQKELIILVQPTIMKTEETQFFIDTTDYMLSRPVNR